MYLTPDAASVRKNHLTGKNHIKLVCDYYENQAKQLGIWNDPGFNYQQVNDSLYKNIPGSCNLNLDEYYTFVNSVSLPPPHTLQGLPNPPAKVLHESIKADESVLNVLK